MNVAKLGSKAGNFYLERERGGGEKMIDREIKGRDKETKKQRDRETELTIEITSKAG